MHKRSQNQNQEPPFDELMAGLFALVTHHSLTRCEATLETIVDRLQQLCHHSEIEYFPNQMKVLIKMRQLWRTELFRSQLREYKH